MSVKSLRLTHSSQTTFQRCPRKYALSHVLRLRPIHAADPLRFGDRWHLGVGLYESGAPIEQVVVAVAKSYLEAPCPPWMTPTKYEVERETCCAMVMGHWYHWHGAEAMTTIEVEKEFNQPIVNPATGRPTPAFTSAGKRDRVARRSDGSVVLVERKTTGEDISPGADYWKRFAAKADGHDIQSIVYDVMRKPEIRPKKVSKADVATATGAGRYFGLVLDARCPDEETPEMFGARLFNDIIERPEFYCARHELTRMQRDLDEFCQEQWQILHQIRRCEHDMAGIGLAAWPRNTAECTGRGRCAYLNICRGMTADPAQKIPDGFMRAESLHPELSPIDGE